MSDPIEAIAARFIEARRKAQPLAAYPGTIPQEMSQSYQIQDRAIRDWGQAVAGWKIGRLAPHLHDRHATQRLAGPIFAPQIKAFSDQTVDIAVFEGGFAAVEAEYVFRLGHDFDPGDRPASEDEVLSHIDGVFAGVEMAGSPLGAINDLGPTVVASDFGNNNGLILGACLAEIDAKTRPAQFAQWVQDFRARTVIDGVEAGMGGLKDMPEGPLAAIAWLARHLSGRGLPLKAGQWVSSGATTGIHRVGAGIEAEVSFTTRDGGETRIALKTVAAVH